MGSCDKKISLKDKDYAKQLTMFYSSTNGVTGLQVDTTMGDTQKLGNTTKTAKNLAKTFVFENNSLLVGFYGTKLDWQINSLGVIYLDPTCIPKADEGTVPIPAPEVSQRSKALLLFEHIAIAILAAALLAMILLIIYLCKKKAFERIHQNIVEPIPIPIST